jgi:hypothetical protein
MKKQPQISRDDKIIICQLAYDWCVQNLKKSKFHSGFPKLYKRSVQSNSLLKGYYKEAKNLIAVYLDNNTTALDICETVIHEWKHYQQDIVIMYDKYETVYKRKGNNHPYEISAENYAKRHASNCLSWIQKKFKT